MNGRFFEEDELVLKSVARRIKILRQEKGFSMDKLALEAELSKNQVWRIENHKQKTTIVTLNRIAIALDVPLKTLFEFDNKAF